MLDVDGFRALIAERGELASDGVVRRIGRVLRGEVRPPGLAGRLGGDEFGVLLRGVRVDDVERVADRLRVVIGRPSPRPAGELVATVSVGVVVLDDRAPSAQEALAAAEAAVSVAKRRGCDRTVMVMGGRAQRRAVTRARGCRASVAGERLRLGAGPSGRGSACAGVRGGDCGGERRGPVDEVAVGEEAPADLFAGEDAEVQALRGVA